MKKSLAIGLLSFGLGILATALVTVDPAGWQCARPAPSPRSDRLRRATPDAAPADTIAVEDREVLYWRAPMDPTFTSDRPGRSPMGMDLVPVYRERGREPAARHGADRPGLRAAHRRPHRAGRPAPHRPDHPHRRHAGPQRSADLAWVNTKYDGWIENVAVNYLGETVEAGQVLFDIYSPQLVTTQMEYLQAGGLRRAAGDVPLSRDSPERGTLARRLDPRAAQLLGHH